MNTGPTRKPVESALPVLRAAFAVLAALADAPRPGFEILEVIDESVPGHSILGPGTLYRLLRELRREGWIERTDAPKDDETDDRRQYHKLTPLGRSILHAEAARLRRTLQEAGLLSQPPQS